MIEIAALKMVRENNVGILEKLRVWKMTPLKLDIFERLRKLALTTYEACLFFVLALKIVRI
jgi:hypothetical protein